MEVSSGRFGISAIAETLNCSVTRRSYGFVVFVSAGDELESVAVRDWEEILPAIGFLAGVIGISWSEVSEVFPPLSAWIQAEKEILFVLDSDWDEIPEEEEEFPPSHLTPEGARYW